MRIYISGNISIGNAKKNLKKFFEAEKMLKSFGYEVVNPVRLNSDNWINNISRDIKIIAKCDAIYLLKDWKKSYGSKIEYLVAGKLKKQIYE